MLMGVIWPVHMLLIAKATLACASALKVIMLKKLLQ